MALNRIDSPGARQTPWSLIQNRPHLEGREIVGDVKDAELRQLLTQDFAHRSLEIEHTGSLIVSRNIIRSTLKHFELFEEARVWTTGVISLRYAPGLCRDNALNIRAGLSNQLQCSLRI